MLVEGGRGRRYRLMIWRARGRRPGIEGEEWLFVYQGPWGWYVFQHIYMAVHSSFLVGVGVWVFCRLDLDELGLAE